MNYYYSLAFALITVSNLVFILCLASNDNATTANEQPYQADWYPFCGTTDADYGPKRFWEPFVFIREINKTPKDCSYKFSREHEYRNASIQRWPWMVLIEIPLKYFNGIFF
jgi:hypothetical protein